MSPVDPLRKVIGAVDRFQRRTPVVAVPYAVQKKFGNDNANLVVVALAWYGFTAIFPLLLAVVTVFQIIGAQSLGHTLVNTLQEFPIVGTNLKVVGKSPGDGSVIGLVVGLVGLLYGAQGVTQTAQLAMATVWNVPQYQRTGFLPRLGRSIAGLITIGGAFVINAFVTTYATGGTSNYAIRVPVLAGLLIVNIALYFAAFTLLTAKVIGPRGLLPGAIAGGIAFTALITVGTGLITHELKNADETYGTFGTVIGIVAFLLLLAKLSMYAAELNPVLSRKLYPRALPMGEPTDADHRVLADVVYQEQGRKDQAIGVGFGDDAANLAAADAASRMRPRQAPDDETPDKQTPGEQVPDAQAPGEQTPGEQVPDAQAPDEKAPDKQVPDGQAPDEKVTGAAQSAGRHRRAAAETGPEPTPGDGRHSRPS
jgi:uncharacterized BrkB/YihY/UPF0761 family membrane protein